MRICLKKIKKMSKTSLFSTVSEREAKNLSPVTLAFLGDAVYSLYVREKYVLKADYPSGTLQKLTSGEVSAHGQNVTLERVKDTFNEAEEAIFRRGRNAKKSTHSKNATLSEYNNSTGFEAVLGYLYLTGQYARIEELLEGE